MLALALAAALMTGPPPKVIVVTATAGYRHESIETAESVIAAIAGSTRAFTPHFVRTESELSPALSPSGLAGARAIVFLNTTGELAWPERARLIEWVRGGGAFVGIHSASDTWHEWPAYIEMLGGEFESHPEEMTRNVIVADRSHPATSLLPSPHALFEEFYEFKNFSGDGLKLLLMLDDGAPMAWSRLYGNGRVFYTALGHRSDVWTSQWFQRHVTGALFWALGHDVVPRRRAVGR